jgi:hypothetical protein
MAVPVFIQFMLFQHYAPILNSGSMALSSVLKLHTSFFEILNYKYMHLHHIQCERLSY